MFFRGSGNGKWLRVYDNTTRLSPHLNLSPLNVQISFGHNRPPECAGRRCTIFLDNQNAVVPAIYTQPN